MDYLHGYRPGKATVKGVPQDRPAFDVTAIYSDEADDAFGTKGRAERIDWARYLHGRGLLLAPGADRGRLQSRIRLTDGRHRRAYLLLCHPDAVPRLRERRPKQRVLTW